MHDDLLTEESVDYSDLSYVLLQHSQGIYILYHCIITSAIACVYMMMFVARVWPIVPL